MRKIYNYFFDLYCCFGGKFITGVSFYLLFLVFHYEKNYPLMCSYYSMSPDDINSFLLFIFSDGFFLILFLPVLILAISWKLFHFYFLDCLKLIKSKKKSLIIHRYIIYSITIITTIIAYLLLCVILVGKIINMHFTTNIAFISNLIFTYINLVLLMLIHFTSAIIFYSNSTGILTTLIPIVSELMVWKNHITKGFKFTFFYNIVTQDNIYISIPQKIFFWTVCLIIFIIILLIIIQYIDFGVNRNIRDVMRYISHKYSINPWFIGAIIWSFIYVSLTYRITCNFYDNKKEFVYICFRGFSELNIQDLIFYLGLCLPLWIFLVYYNSKFFNTYFIYIFMKMGSISNCILKCMLNTVKYTIIYFITIIIFSYIGENFIYRTIGEIDIYKNLQQVSGGMISITTDYILVSLLLVLFIMVIYLLCYRLEIAFITGIGCHTLNVIIASLIPFRNEFIPFTQNILLIRKDNYNIILAKSFTFLSLVIIYFMFFYLIKKKQEKILIGYYQ